MICTALFTTCEMRKTHSSRHSSANQLICFNFFFISNLFVQYGVFWEGWGYLRIQDLLRNKNTSFTRTSYRAADFNQNTFFDALFLTDCTDIGNNKSPITPANYHFTFTCQSIFTLPKIMSEKIDPSKEAVITVAEIIFQKAIVCSSAPEASGELVQQPEWEPVQITELVSAISSHPFDAFVACHRHLHDKVNCQTDKSKEHKLVSKQLKMCLHERDQTVHSCMNKILISVFQIHKNHANISVTVDAELLPRVFEFLTSFTCVSQLTNLLDLFNLHNLNIQELLPYTKQMIDQSCLIHASIVINKFGIHNHFDSNSLLLELLHEVIDFCSVDKFSFSCSSPFTGQLC